jgi:flagellar hook-length control protein FliK
MQTSVPVAPQIQAASSVPQPALSQPAGADWAPSGQPQFDAAMAMAMAAQTSQTTKPAEQLAATLPTAPPIPATPATPTPQTLPLPPPDPAAAPPPSACQAAAAPTTRKDEAVKRQRSTPAVPPPAVDLSAMPAIQGMPPGPPADPCIRPAGVPVARSHAAPPENAAAVVESAGGLQAASAVPGPVEPQSTVPDGPQPRDQGVPDAAANVPPIQSPSPVATQLAPTLLPASTPAPAAASSTPVSASPRPAVATPADQVAPVLVSMAHAADGAQRMTLRLEPPDLGHVEIRIDRTADAPAHVNITVERPETLILMLRDQPQLQRALDQAGVPPDGRSVTFHIATAEPGARSDAGQSASTGLIPAGSGDGSYGASRQGGGPAHRKPADTDDMETDLSPVALPGWARAGLDITA